MAILAEQRVSFGGRVTDILNVSFVCVVTTAKEGFFKGLTTVVYDETRRPCVKLFYAGSTGKRDRQMFHDLVSQIIDSAGEKGLSLQDAVDEAIAVLTDRGVLADGVNLA